MTGKPQPLNLLAWEILKKKEKFVALLVHSDWRVREKAEKALNRIDPGWRSGKDAQAYIPTLIEDLKDEERGARAASALGLIGADQAVSPLVSALRHENEYVRRAAAGALGNMNASTAVGPLIAATRDENEYVRASALEALGRIGDREGMVPAIVALKDRHEYVRRTAAQTLESIGNERAVEPLIAAMRDLKIAGVAAKALGAIGDKRAINTLVAALTDDREHVRASAAEALGRIGDVGQIERIVTLLSDKIPSVRLAAVNALGLIRDSKAVRPLIKVLKNRFHSHDAEITEAAAKALGEIGNARAADELIAACQDSYSKAAASALKRMSKMNQPFCDHYPDLFCPTCFLRAKQLRRWISSIALVFCPSCYDYMELLTGIKKVAGVIGGEAEGLQRNGDTLWVPLWNERERKARYADIDLLIIRAGVGNYHFALNAVIIELTAGTKNGTGTIPASMDGTFRLSKVEMNMLRDNFRLETEINDIPF